MNFDFGELSKLNAGQLMVSLQAERENLLKQKTEIEDQLVAVEQKIEALRFIGNPEAYRPPIREMGLEDAVRTIFRLSRTPLTVNEMVLELMSAGFSVIQGLQKSVEATIVKMLGELEQVSRPEGMIAYRSKQQNSPPSQVG